MQTRVEVGRLLRVFCRDLANDPVAKRRGRWGRDPERLERRCSNGEGSAELSGADQEVSTGYFGGVNGLLGHALLRGGIEVESISRAWRAGKVRRKAVAECAESRRSPPRFRAFHDRFFLYFGLAA